MTIKLKAGEAAYALYKEETNEYVYLGGGNGFYGFKPYPKPTGMSTSIEKLEKKRDGLTARLQEYVDNGGLGLIWMKTRYGNAANTYTTIAHNSTNTEQIC